MVLQQKVAVVLLSRLVAYPSVRFFVLLFIPNPIFDLP